MGDRSRLNLRQMLYLAQDIEAEQHRIEEAGKIGELRAGNTACVDSHSGLVIGGDCTRKTALRFLGIEVETPTRDRLLMFAGGILNEDYWLHQLGIVRTGDILREEEAAIKWTLPGTEVEVTGRPDIVLLDDEGEAELGIELKCISSLWTYRDTTIQDKPKLGHILQASHYARQLEVPYKLAYTSYVDYPVNGWVQKHFPRRGRPGSELAEYNDKGDIKKVLPTMQAYDIWWDDETGLLLYAVEGEREYRSVPGVTWGGIEEYYLQVLEAATLPGARLPRRPGRQAVDGSRMNYSPCDYCPLADTCTRLERSGGGMRDLVDAVGGGK